MNKEKNSNGLSETVALIPARGGSKSIPLKNIKLIGGRPLIYWALDAAVGCGGIDKIYVSTDCPLIREKCLRYGSDKIQVIDRSQETATDSASTESVMLEFCEKYIFKNLVLIQATSPMITKEDLSLGINKYKKGNADTLLSAVKQKRFIWSHNKSTNHYNAVNYDPSNRPLRQNFDGNFIENGAFYICKRDEFLKRKTRLFGKIDIYPMKEESLFELDEKFDEYCINNLLRLRKKQISGNVKLNDIKLFITDVDGCLTDCGMYYTENCDELKKFNTRDGMAFQLLKENNIKLGIITSENTNIVRRRAEKLNVDYLVQGAKDKKQELNKILEKENLCYENVAYIGDDINDLSVLKSVGFSVCPKDAHYSIKEIVKYESNYKGGEGVIREIADLILNSRRELIQ